MIYHVVSMSSGKDSTASLCVALETVPFESIKLVAADTGNEHESFVPYLKYLEQKVGIPVTILRRDFTEWWWRRRDYILDKWHLPHKNYPNGVPAAAIERVLQFFEKGPTGNPYLDLCIIKGRFPSRRAQFCTQFLKTEPLVEWQDELLQQGHIVWSWQGVRIDESGSRRARLQGTGACVKSFEEVGGGLFIYRPVLRWKAMDTFEAMSCLGIEPNPLYKMGMDRVGCFPCINSDKETIRTWALRWPEHVDRIEEWESIVGFLSKSGYSTFFALLNGDGEIKTSRQHFEGGNIRQVIRWAQTTRGGMQMDLLAGAEDSAACSSSYGLCEN